MNLLLRYILTLSLPLYVLDQLTKWWVVFHFEEPYRNSWGQLVEPRQVVVEGFFNLVRRHNQGVAFGMGNGTSWAPLVFLGVLVVALVLVVVLWKKGQFPTRLMKVAAALLLAGIAGNLTDRLLQGFWLESFQEADFWTRLAQGYVVDFLDFRLPGTESFLPGGHWPAFNVADSCISVAAVLLFISAFFTPLEAESKDTP